MSKLEHVIDEIEDYIDTCKFQPLSKTAIIVDKKILDAKLRELRNLIPDELKKYQTIISNKDAILDDARQKAHTLIDDAQSRRNELINEHEVMRQAYEQANEVVTTAAKQASELLDSAQTEANGMKEAAVRYTDKLLGDVEQALQGSIDATNNHLKELLSELSAYNDTVKENRAALELPKPETDEEKAARAEKDREQESPKERKRTIGGDKKTDDGAGSREEPEEAAETGTGAETENTNGKDAAGDTDGADEADRT